MDKAIAVGFPVDPGERQEIARIAGMPLHEPYTGSVVHRCVGCGLRIYLGPRQTAAVRAQLADPHCARCVAKSANLASGPADIIDLGNDEQRRHEECDCRNPRCGHKASKHVGEQGACIEPGCPCGPGGWC